jgi:hypothetical protein
MLFTIYFSVGVILALASKKAFIKACLEVNEYRIAYAVKYNNAIWATFVLINGVLWLPALLFDLILKSFKRMFK